MKSFTIILGPHQMFPPMHGYWFTVLENLSQIEDRNGLLNVHCKHRLCDPDIRVHRKSVPGAAEQMPVCLPIQPLAQVPRTFPHA